MVNVTGAIINNGTNVHLTSYERQSVTSYIAQLTALCSGIFVMIEDIFRQL